VEGCFDVTAAYNSPDPLVVDFGSSFVMVASMGRRGVTARALLTHSQSTNSTSAHSQDQTQLFARKQWTPY
jgi:hypothetical protein